MASLSLSKKLEDHRRHRAQLRDLTETHEDMARLADAVLVDDKTQNNGCFSAVVAGVLLLLAVVFGARSYKSSSGRVIQRRSNGRFRQTTLKDFGISKTELTVGGMICNGCGYGSNEYWRPILMTGICPKCGSRDKRQAVQS